MLRLALILTFAGSPALAAGYGGYDFTSLFNTDYVVLIGFLLFLALLFYRNVPATLMGMLDSRAAGIQSELDEARSLREEAQKLLASYQRKQREVAEQSERIIAHAREDAKAAAEQAKLDLQTSIDRRLKAAEEQIESAEQKAVKDVRDTAVDVAIAAASKVIADQMTASSAGKMIDASIAEVQTRFH